MKKRLLVENDIDEMADFQKILLLNKRKLNSDDVEFKSDKYDGLQLNHVQVKPDGLLFDFDDLEQFLKFFHYPAFEEGTDGEWDAINYDRMYYGSFDFTNILTPIIKVESQPYNFNNYNIGDLHDYINSAEVMNSLMNKDHFLLANKLR